MGYRPPPIPPDQRPGSSPYFVKCEYCDRYPEPDRPYCPGCGRAVETFRRKEKREEIEMNIKVNPDLDPELLSKELGKLWGRPIYKLTPEILEDPGFISRSFFDLPDPPKPSRVIR